MPSLWLTADRTLNVAHQGASAAAPSNTLAAFHRAAEMGADGVELDVHLSADGVPVVIHDATVDRTTDGAGRVADLPLSSLRALDAGSWFDPSFAGERIPTLEDVFVSVGGRLLVNVELKVARGGGQELAAAVVSLVRRYDLVERVLVSSFNPLALRQVRRVAPRVPLGLLYTLTLVGWLSRLWYLLACAPRVEAVHPHWRLVRPATVRLAHARGQRVLAWTVDEADAMRRLTAWGVGAIITNHPDVLREVLDR